MTANLVTSFDQGSRGWRAIYHLAGEKNWGRQCLQQLLTTRPQQKVFWVSDDAPPGSLSTVPEKFQHYLGIEADILVFDAYRGFNVDSLAAMTGILRGGGCFFLLTPSLDCWAQSHVSALSVVDDNAAHPESFFIQRFMRLLKARPSVFTVEQTRYPDPKAVLNAHPLPAVFSSQAAEGSEDQKTAVQAILRVVHGHRRRPLVLTADRGRGKTAALGRAAAQLLLEKPRRIVITALNRASVATAFWHAKQLLPDFELQELSLRQGSAGLFFMPPDVLLAEPQALDLLLIDEAAAIPLPMLEALLHNHARVVFASTVHGYEGTGRGFEIRFKALLNRVAPQWKSLFLKTPIRWQHGDPLEQFIFEALLLDADYWQPELTILPSADNLVFDELQPAQLAHDETTLRELFGLLVQAHYRTRPSDLRMLLDEAALRIFALTWQGHIVAASVWMLEGGFSPEIATDIAQAKRRPQGHLLPQTLAQHWGLSQAAQLKAARVVRIAVHPAWQRQGLGRRLIKQAEDCLRDKADYLGSSFGATTELLAFWSACGFVPLRLGFKREAASAEHALLVGRAVSPTGQALIEKLKNIFEGQLPLQLPEYYHEVPADLLLALLRPSLALPVLPFSDYEQARVAAYSEGQQSYEQCCGLLWKYVLNRLSQPSGWSACQPLEKQALLKKILQKKSWLVLKNELALDQVKTAQVLLRQAIRSLLTGG
ncbi:MAG TPA: GNAT family N-acetyltransferase [Pseudomonadales bacterium]|nr:GNAT family N-acetyltransferase [Pseudomonadales bacterium]